MGFVMQSEVLIENKIMSTSTVTVVTANGPPLNILGCVIILIAIDNFKCIKLDCILGADCLMHYGMIIDCKECTVTMGRHQIFFSYTINNCDTICRFNC